MVLGQMDIHMQNNEVGPYLTPYTKINSKWTRGLNISIKTIKFSEESMQVDNNFGLGNGFLEMASETQAKRKKIDKLNFTKI